MAKKKMLLIVDPQIDFISGTLPVPHAGKAMDALANYVKEHNGDYDLKIVTNDWHPYHHSSFAPQGGQWPVHCVQYSEGAATYRPLLEALYCTTGETKFLIKGDSADREEYSIMQNENSADFLRFLLENEKKDAEVHVCGLAGDVCVLNTLRDLQTLCGNRLSVFKDFSPSIDSGEALSQFLAESKIKTL